MDEILVGLLLITNSLALAVCFCFVGCLPCALCAVFHWPHGVYQGFQQLVGSMAGCSHLIAYQHRDDLADTQDEEIVY